MDPEVARRRTTALTLLLLVPLLSLGAVEHVGITLTLAAAGIAAIVLATQRFTVTSAAERLGLAALLASPAWSILQLVPLPRGLLRALSPVSDRVWRDVELVLELPAHWRPLSVDPPGTAFAAATGLAVVAVFCAVLYVARDRRGGRAARLAILSAVGITGIVALVQSAFGLHKVYGLFGVNHAAPPLILSPLLNPNHAAAVACVGPPIALAVALETKSPAGRLGTLTLGAICATNALLALSRGGIVVLAAELLVMTVLFVAARRTQRGHRVATLVVPSAAMLAAAIALYVGGSRLVREASDTSTTKLEIAKQAFLATREYWLTGAGRGTFVAAFPAHEDDLAARVGTLTTHLAYSHPESWPAQLAFEHGAPFALLFALALGAAAVIALKKNGRETPRLLTFLALIGLVVHDLADFAMEYAGAASIAAALFAVCIARPADRRRRDEQPPRSVTRWAPLVAVLAALVLSAISWRKTLYDDHERVRPLTAEGKLSEVGELSSSILRHPADPYLAAIEGALHLGDVTGGRHLRRAVQLGPMRPAGHYWLARWFAVVGRRPQAFAEYRVVLNLAPHLDTLVIQDLIRLDAPYEELLFTARTERALDTAAILLGNAGHASEAAAMDDEHVRLFHPALDARTRQIRRAVAAQDHEGARKRAAELVAVAPKEAKAYVVAASVAASKEDAERWLERGTATVGEHPDLAEQWLLLRGPTSEPSVAAADAERLARALQTAGLPMTRLHRTLAEVAIKQGAPQKAIQHLLDASMLDPDDPILLERVATLAEQTGQRALAERTWRHLAAAHPQQAAYKNAVERLRTSAPPVVLPP